MNEDLIIGFNERKKILYSFSKRYLIDPFKPSTFNPTNGNIVRIYAGTNSVFILLDNKKIYVLGDNERGQLGLGHFNGLKEAQESNYQFGIKEIAMGSSQLYIQQVEEIMVNWVMVAQEI